MATKLNEARERLGGAGLRARQALAYLGECEKAQAKAQEAEQWTRLEALAANTADAREDLRVALAAQEEARKNLDRLPTPIDAGDPADGWNKEARDRLGITELLKRFYGVAYELETCQRGSYGIGGDTAADLLSTLNSFAEDLGVVMDAVAQEADVEIEPEPERAGPMAAAQEELGCRRCYYADPKAWARGEACCQRTGGPRPAKPGGPGPCTARDGLSDVATWIRAEKEAGV